MVKIPCKIFSIFRISSLVKYCAFRVRHQNLLSVMYAVFGFQKKKSDLADLFHLPCSNRKIGHYFTIFHIITHHLIPLNSSLHLQKSLLAPPEVSLLLYLILYPISAKCLILYRNQNQKTGFYMKCNTGLKWVNANLL